MHASRRAPAPSFRIRAGSRPAAFSAVLLASLCATASPCLSQNPVSGWGYGGTGCLGDGASNLDQNLPVVSLAPLDVAAVGGGTDFSLAITEGGSVLSWGLNDRGQLGDGTMDSRNIPDLVALPEPALAVSDNGFSHSLVLDIFGQVFAFGANGEGQLGDGTFVDQSVPVMVLDLPATNRIAAGGQHSLALLADATVRAWGYNGYGQLGDGTYDNRGLPVPVDGLANVIDVSAGRNHSLALVEGGTVWAWGDNSFGQLGDGTQDVRELPVPVLGLPEIVDVEAGGFHSLALAADGTVWAWGDNQYGQLGDGTWTPSSLPVSVLDADGLQPLANISQISAGVHNLALDSNGTLWAWGYNFYGELGVGDNLDRNLPVATLCLSSIATIAALDYHSLAVAANSCGTAAAEPLPGGADGGQTLMVRMAGPRAVEIGFELPHAGDVSLVVVDAAGRLVRVLLEEERTAGPQQVIWDGHASSGGRVPSGLYFVRLRDAVGTVTAGRCTLVR